MSNNLIKLIYSLNNEESSVAFDSTNKIAILKNLINLTQKINLDEYEVFYKKKEIKWTDETPIRNIIGKDNVPIFYIRPKKGHEEKKLADSSKAKEENKAKEDKKTDSKTNEKDPKKADPSKSPKEEKKQPDNKNTAKDEKKQPDNKPKDDPKKADGKAATKEADKKSADANPTTAQDKKQDPNKSVDNSGGKEMINLKCKVIVENFPSRPELYGLIEKYEESKQAKHEISQLNTVSGVELTFKNPDLAYDFMKYINLEKINNPLYSKLRTNLVLDAKKVRKVTPKKKTDLMTKTDPKLDNNNNSLDNSHTSPMLSNEPNSRFFRLNNHVSKSQNFKELAVFEHFNKIKDERLKHKLLKKHYKNANFVSLASPYMSEEERYRKENLDMKKKWYDKKGFIVATQTKPKIQSIPNFVNLDHFGESAVTHQFRYDFKEKAKWIDKNGRNFFV